MIHKTSKYRFQRIVCFAILLSAWAVPAYANNLFINGDVETGDMSGWAPVEGVEARSSSTAGTLGLPVGEDIGAWCFSGGLGAPIETASQTIDLNSFASVIDGGEAVFAFDGLIQSCNDGGFVDTAQIQLLFQDEGGATLFHSTFVDPTTTDGVCDWHLFSQTGIAPVGTRSAEVVITTTRIIGVSTDGFVDNLSLTISAESDCLGDANRDGTVDPLDAGFVLARFGCSVDTGDTQCDDADQNNDGLVDPLDAGFVLARFGECD